MPTFGFDFSEFDTMVRQFEEIGVSGDEIADIVLDAVTPDAVEAFRGALPRDAGTDDPYHAQDHVRASKVRTSKTGSRYKIIGVFDGDGKKLDWDEARYLFCVENGTSRMVAKPFIKKAENNMEQVAGTKMKETLETELQTRLGG